MLATLTTLFNLLLVLTGFGLVIVIHELGHFLAARWAGVRVLAFAVGFGPALFSWRKGLGFRRGSSEAEYRSLQGADAAGVTTEEGARATHHGISPTEYRFNVFPFGGYVKMLGQDDANPGATSSAPDSYTSAPVAKRMVIISAGVVMNLILAAGLFIAVFLAGLRTEPPRIGDVLPGSPAAQAVALNAAELGVGTGDPGLHPGDTVMRIGGSRPQTFNDLILAGAMAAPGRALDIEVERPGLPRPLRFAITPRVDKFSRMLQIGVGPAASARLPEAPDEQTRAAFRAAADALGLPPEIQPGMRLTSVNGQPVASADAATLAARRSSGHPVQLVFESDAGGPVAASLQPEPEFQTTEFLKDDDLIARVPHLLGIPAPMRVDDTAEAGAKAGLKPGDVFARIGDVDWPTVTAGMTAIRARAGGTVGVVVARPSASGELELVDLGEVPVSRQKTIGFLVAVDPAQAPAVVATWPSLPVSPDSEGPPPPQTPAAALQLIPGSRIIRVNDDAITTCADLRAALRRATESAAHAGGGAEVALTLRLPLPAAGDGPPTERITWALTPDAVATLHTLGWDTPLASLFPREEILLKASNPVEAIGMGLQETRRVMLSTYLTLARLVQGTVKVEHLRGPVGIAHVGTLLAERGVIWLLFFLALVSVNLAVVNFLPLPIADGGHMVYLTYEAATGRPVSPAVQNAAALAGLVLIVGLFLIVTFNDVTRLFGF